MKKVKTLEEEIQSSKPIPVFQRAMLNILFTASWADVQMQRRLKPHRITHQQYNILRILNGSSPAGLSVLDIKNRMIDRASNVSRLVEKLRAAGLVERIASPTDRRMVVVSIAEAGRQVLEKIHADNFFQNLPGSRLSEAESIELGLLLDKFRH